MPKKYNLLLLLVTFFIAASTSVSIAQNAPVTTCATVAGAIQGTVSVPLTVTGFTNIGAISLSLDYDYAVVQFLSGTPNPALPNFLSGDADLGNGYHRISMGWFGSSSTLADGSTIMTLNFNYVSGNSSLTLFDNGASCEYADAMGNVLNDIPTEDYYINGYLCGAIGNPGPIEGNDSVCQGQSGESYTVLSLPNVDGYTWTLPEGTIIVNGQNTNSITVDYSETAVSGNITVYAFNPCGNGPSSMLPVTVNTLPIANAGNDTTINNGTSTTLHAASGGSGTFSYHWSPEELLVDPDVQNPQTVILTTTTIFNLVVTNQASSCQAIDEVIVTITGGPLSVNPVAIPGNICNGEYAQLYSNAGGGSGEYYYQWVCPDPFWTSNEANPVVSPDTTMLYILSVYDNFTNVEDSVSLDVFQLPSATISGGDTLCGTGNFTTLQVDLTGTPPWSFIYTNGITSVIVNNQYTSPYYIITGDPGTYTILDLEDANCTGPSFGSAKVFVFPYPETPEINVLEFTLISSVCCGNQWYLDDEPISGATSQIYVATESGWYYDIVTLNGCSSDTSEAIDLVVGIHEPATGSALTLASHPNPFSGYTTLKYNLPIDGFVTLQVSDMTGRKVSMPVGEHQGIGMHSLKLDALPLQPGIYFATIKLDTGEGVLIQTIKLLKNR